MSTIDLPAGMRNNNPGNLKYNADVRWNGLVGPSINTDQGDPQAVFESQELGLRATAKLAINKYNSGLRTVRDIITAEKGWTPGYLPAAKNIAKAMGVGLDEDLHLDKPERQRGFLRALVAQEHGPASKAYTDDMIDNAIVAAKDDPQSQGLGGFLKSVFGTGASAEEAPAGGILGSFFGSKPASVAKPESLSSLGDFDDAQNVSYSNQRAQRNQPLNPDTHAQLARAVEGFFGPGFRADVVSGKGVMRDKYGNPTKKGNHNHPLGTAADFDVVNTETGERVGSKTMKDFGVYAAMKGFTGIGGPGYMGDGRVHLDTNHPGLSTWGGANLSGILDAKERGFAFPGPGAPVPTARPEQETAVASAPPGPPSGGLGSIFSTSAQAAPAPQGLGAFASNEADIQRMEREAGMYQPARPSFPGIAGTEASVQRLERETPGMYQPGFADAKAGRLARVSATEDDTQRMERETGMFQPGGLGSVLGTAAAAAPSTERTYTPPDQPGSLHVGGLQPIGAETAITGTTPQAMASLAPGLMGGATQTSLAAPGIGAMPFQGAYQAFTPTRTIETKTIAPIDEPAEDTQTITAPKANKAIKANNTIAAPEDTFPAAPAPPTRMETLNAATAVALDKMGLGFVNKASNAITGGLGSLFSANMPTMSGPDYGSGLGAMQQAMGGAPGGFAQSRSNPGYSYGKTATGGVRYGPYGWQTLDEAGETTGALRSYGDNKTKGLGGFFSGLFGGEGKSKSKDKDKDKGGLGGYSGKGLY
jgi:hypothetical protein